MFVASAVNARLDLTGRSLCRITDTTWYSWFMLIGGVTQLCGGLMFLGIVSLPANWLKCVTVANGKFLIFGLVNALSRS